MKADEFFEIMTNFASDPAAALMYGGPLVVFLVILVSVSIYAKSKRLDLEKVDKEISATPASSKDFGDRSGTKHVPAPQTTHEPDNIDTQEAKEVFGDPGEQPHQLDVEKSEIDSSADASIEESVDSRKSQSLPVDVSEIKSLGSEKWLSKLRGGLSKSRAHLSEGISRILSGKAKIDEEILEDIHETLYRADVGVKTADDLINHVKSCLVGKEANNSNEVKNALKSRMIDILNEAEKAENEPSSGPQVVLVVGVNGVGKTTSIGKLAAHYLAKDKKVLLCAADTFRAAAIDQLKVWGERLEVDVVAHKQGADPASVAFDGVKAALKRDVDVLLIDTAGRLHNKQELMEELSKIKRVIQKDLPEAPHETWIVVDSTTGQNASQQVKAFSDAVSLSGIIVTKLDGTAKGGVVIGVSHTHKLPIKYIGVGEKAADLREFKPADFVEYLL